MKSPGTEDRPVELPRHFENRQVISDFGAIGPRATDMALRADRANCRRTIAAPEVADAALGAQKKVWFFVKIGSYIQIRLLLV